jgi:hypothetical protein
LIAVRARQLVVRRNIVRGSRKPVACFRTHCGQCGSFPPNRRASCCPEVRYTQLLATCAGSFLALSMSAMGRYCRKSLCPAPIAFPLRIWTASRWRSEAFGGPARAGGNADATGTRRATHAGAGSGGFSSRRASVFRF